MASAIRHAVHQADGHDATLHALYVVDVRAYAILPEPTRTQVHDFLVEAGEEALEFVESVGEDAGVEVVTAVREGVPADAILDYIEEAGIDLVAMGTHGETGDGVRVVGSVAEAVVGNATVPVLTVRVNDADAATFDDDLPVHSSRYIH